jgi:hypothetical protein
MSDAEHRLIHRSPPYRLTDDDDEIPIRSDCDSDRWRYHDHDLSPQLTVDFTRGPPNDLDTDLVQDVRKGPTPDRDTGGPMASIA